MMLPAGFGRCSTCGRLLVVDGLNPDGRCTPECGGHTDAYRIEWSPDSWPHLVLCADPGRCVWCGQPAAEVQRWWGPCPGDLANAVRSPA